MDEQFKYRATIKGANKLQIQTALEELAQYQDPEKREEVECKLLEHLGTTGNLTLLVSPRSEPRNKDDTSPRTQRPIDPDADIEQKDSNDTETSVPCPRQLLVEDDHGKKKKDPRSAKEQPETITKTLDSEQDEPDPDDENPNQDFQQAGN